MDKPQTHCHYAPQGVTHGVCTCIQCNHDCWDEWQKGILEAAQFLFGKTPASTAFIKDFEKTSKAFMKKHLKKTSALSKQYSDVNES